MSIKAKRSSPRADLSLPDGGYFIDFVSNINGNLTFFTFNAVLLSFGAYMYIGFVLLFNIQACDLLICTREIFFPFV